MKRKLFSFFNQYRIYIDLLLLICSVLVVTSLFVDLRTFNPKWKVRHTKHFLIYYEKDSPAYEDIKMLAEIIEDYYDQTTQMFNIKSPKKINYFFHNGELSHRGRSIWGYSNKMGVYVVYSDSKKDTSPHELRHFIQDIVNPNIPYFFNEGICGYQVEIRGEGFHEKIRAISPNLNEYNLVNLVDNFQTYSRLGDYFAYSFNSFLVDEYGQEKYAGFYKQATKDNWQELIKDIFGSSADDLEQKWKDFLRN